MVVCPICDKQVKRADINNHIDSGCEKFLFDPDAIASTQSSSGTRASPPPSGTQNLPVPSSTQKRSAASFFQTPSAKRQATSTKVVPTPAIKANGVKRSYDEGPGRNEPTLAKGTNGDERHDGGPSQSQPTQASPGSMPLVKRTKTNKSAPLAEQMRPKSLDEVFGQDLVGPRGVLRHLIETDQVPSMILWGGSGTGKTTIARCIAEKVKSRFIELNATSTGVAECKKYFAEAANEQQLTGRRTIIFCDEIHRFTKAQQDVFLKPVEAGTITLIGATTENPSFKVQNALLSRCRTFTLAKLTTDDVKSILKRAIGTEVETNPSHTLHPLIDEDLVTYLAAFADGDARTALNLLELTLGLLAQPVGPDDPPITKETIKASLTKTMIYDRAGDQHYDTISAFHKSVRGNDPDAAVYYLARMLQSGEDPLYVARRMVVIASEDVGLADSSLLPLATAAYTAAQQLGMPECRIPLAHCAIALALAPKSTRAYRALNNAFHALKEPGVAGLPIPLHLRNAPTRLMRELGYGAAYKYPPNYRDGKVKQEYMPDALRGRKFMDDRDLGTEVDPDLEAEAAEEVGDDEKEVEDEEEKEEDGDKEEDEENKEDAEKAEDGEEMENDEKMDNDEKMEEDEKIVNGDKMPNGEKTDQNTRKARRRRTGRTEKLG